MSAKQTSQKIESEESHNIGARVAKGLSTRMPFHSGSKEGASKEGAGESGIGQQALDKRGETKDQIPQRNFSDFKNIASKGENTNISAGQGDATGGAAAGATTTGGVVAGRNIVGGTSAGDLIGQELSGQTHISDDVFNSGSSSQAAATKGLYSAGGLELGAGGGGMLGQNVKQDLNQGAFSRETTTTAATAGTSGVKPTRIVKNLSGSSYKVTVLQEKLQAVSQKCKTQLGLSASEISQRSPTVDAFFDTVATERLRWMPRDGSRLDCCLRWASRLAYAVDALRESIGAFAPGANEAAKLIWGFEILLLEVSVFEHGEALGLDTNSSDIV